MADINDTEFTRRQDVIKTCANCGHFEILGEGYEIGRIEDLKYMESRCAALGWEVREHYAFGTGGGPGRKEIHRPPDCPLWKPIKEPADQE